MAKMDGFLLCGLEVLEVEISNQAIVGAWMTKFTYYFMKMMIPKWN